MDTLKQRLGANIKARRKHLGFTQAEVAEAVGLSEKSIGFLERGDVWPEYENLVEICKVLKMHELSVFEGESVKSDPTPAEALAVLAEHINKPKAHEPKTGLRVIEGKQSPPLKKRLPANLKRIRESLGLSMEEAAKRSKLDIVQYGVVEDGIAFPPDFGMIRDMASAFGCTIEDLLDDHGDQEIATKSKES